MMKNEEKYVTTEERMAGFDDFCCKHQCDEQCPLFSIKDGLSDRCAIAWLKLPYEEDGKDGPVHQGLVQAVSRGEAAGMSMETPKDAVVLNHEVVESRAEALMAMDVLMKHLNDEDDQTFWLTDGVPDGAPPLRMTQEQLEYYEQFVDDFENIVKEFARTVRRVCFKTAYEPKGFC